MSPSAGVREIGSQLLIEPPRIAGNFSKDQRKQIENGQEVFRSLCFACHGFDGKGMPMPGREGVTLAPPLSGSRTAVQGDSLIRVLLHGLTGPVDGKTYEAQMVPMGANPDQWVADVACYIRKAFGNQGAMVTKDDVKRVRQATMGRSAPWSIEELRAGFPQPLTNTKEWKLTASTEKDLARAIDGDGSTRWTTGKFQVPGQWFEIELPAETEIAGILLDTVRSRNDYPRGYKVELSSDGTHWDRPALEGSGSDAITELNFARTLKARFIKITQTGSARGNYWSIHEVQVLKPVEKRPGAKTAAK
jgi:mono/diheme cytochrome c family protein